MQELSNDGNQRLIQHFSSAITDEQIGHSHEQSKNLVGVGGGNVTKRHAYPYRIRSISSQGTAQLIS
jgi:hypothetical protein